MLGKTAMKVGLLVILCGAAAILYFVDEKKQQELAEPALADEKKKEEQAHGQQVEAGARTPKLPFTFKAKTGIIFYVETDGRHMAAIDRNGKILWHKTPYEDKAIFGKKIEGRVIYRLLEADDSDLELMQRRGKTGQYIRVSCGMHEVGLLNQNTGELTILWRF
jgi:hypothetical protein